MAHIPARAGSSTVGGPLFPDRSFLRFNFSIVQRKVKDIMQIKIKINALVAR